MKITSVECFALKLENDEPYLGVEGSPPDGYAVRKPWRSLYSRRFESAVVRIESDEGVVGWGEALAPVGPEIVSTVIATLLADFLIGEDPRRVTSLVARMRDLMRERGHQGGHQADAIAALDIALFDLAGRLTEQPIHQLLGGAHRSHIPTYVSGLVSATDELRANEARDWHARGCGAIKLHLGKGIEQDLATVEAIRDAVPDVALAVDAHWHYDRPTARSLARRLSDAGVIFLERTAAPEDIAAHAELARVAELPIATGEAFRHRYEAADWLQARAIDLIQPDVGRTGIAEATVMAQLAGAHHIPTAPHHSTGLGIALAAGLQLAAVVEDLRFFEFQPISAKVGQRILTRPIAGGPDGFNVPDGPGLGIEVDEDIIRGLAR